MDFNLQRSIEILSATPKTLSAMLSNLSQEWIHVNEGPDTWSVFDVVGHLIHGEKTDWIPRLEILLSSGIERPFNPFDRFAQFEENKGKSLSDLLEEFYLLRHSNITLLTSKNISETDYLKKGIHPAFGEVTLVQLLATWTVHDLNHISQISRIMSRQYQDAVGPWVQYLGILK